MATALFQGCATALITPFKAGKVDFPALERLVDFQVENGVDGIVACGTTGEPATMTNDEWEQALSCIVRQVKGRIPVIAGTGGNNTAEVIRKARRARELGADAQLCVTPFYNKATQGGLIAHYRAIARDGALPVILYNVPSRTNVNILPETLETLSYEDGVIAIKEASGNMTQIMEMIRRCESRITFYCGSDELSVPFRAVGGSGTVSVLSNIAPALMRRITHDPLEQAARLNLRAMPLISALFSEVNPIPVKAAAAMLGLCENEVRLPLVPLSPHHEEVLKEEMKKAGLLC